MKKNLKKILLFFTSACILLSSASCAVPPVSGKADPATPEEVLTAYVTAINARDYEKMYSLIHKDSNIKKEDFIARNKNIYSGIGAKNIKAEIVDKKSVYGSITYKMTMDTQAGPVSFNNNAVFKQSGGQPKILWSSRLIFPNLNDDEKVSVDTKKAERGSILDRNGNLIAGKDKVFSVGFVPGKINPETRDADIAKVAELLNMTVEAINKKLSESWVKEDLFVPLKNISYTDTAKKDELLKIKGVGLNTAKDRVYKLGEKAAHLSGYIHTITQEELDKHKDEYYTADSKIGKVGLESLLEERIRGIDGCKISIAGKDGKEKEVLAERKARNGEDVTLTIDSALQQKLYDKMAADKGTAVIMDPKTGEVLALVSTPSYDPNGFVLGLTEEKWAEYNDEQKRPMVNRFKAAYAPGSSFKPVTAAVGLTKGAFGAGDDFGPSGTSWKKDDSWGAYTVTTLKTYSVPANTQNALIYSDNIYFAKAALKIGKEAFAQGLKDVGFGEQVPFEFGLTKSTFGTKLAFDSEVGLADSGYGQGKVLINPIHLASIYTAFVNGGNMIAPHLEMGKETQVWKEKVFSGETVEVVKNALVQVIENPNGTAHSFKIEGRKFAGKTGTAEIKQSKEDTEGTELGWFAAFPVDGAKDKNYLALAMVEDVKGRGGSHYVIPIVRSLFTDKE